MNDSDDVTELTKRLNQRGRGLDKRFDGVLDRKILSQDEYSESSILLGVMDSLFKFEESHRDTP